MTDPASEPCPQSGPPAEAAGAAADPPPAAEQAVELVEAIEVLDHLIEEKGDALLKGGSPEKDDYAPPEVPLLVDVVRGTAAWTVEEDPEEDVQRSFEEFAAMDEAPPGEQPDSATLQMQLIDELRHIIDDGLNRVAETTRAAVAQELKGRTGFDAPVPDRNPADAALPSEMRTLAQAVDDALEKCGLDFASHEEFYVDLLGDLNSILRGGLDLIRRNMEMTVRARLQKHAERTLEGLNLLRAEQQQELPWPNSGDDAPAGRPPLLEPYRDNGDNPGRPG